MGKIRFYIALILAKLSKLPLRLSGHKGTDFPGALAIRIAPDFLKYIDKPSRLIGITGTNGKTTVVNLVHDALEFNYLKVLSNLDGSNTKSGICTTFIEGVNLFNQTQFDIAILEVDERSLPRISEFFSLDYLLINNLTRDSIMRNGHPEYISQVLSSGMPSNTKLILNADDLIASSVAPGNSRVYFGIDRLSTDSSECINLINDVRICPSCHKPLNYEFVRYHHIGRANCKYCGFKSAKPEYLMTSFRPDKLKCQIKYNNDSFNFKLLSSSILNSYNQLATITLIHELGYSFELIQEMLNNVTITETRYSKVKISDTTIIRQLTKDRNALATSRVFDELTKDPSAKEIIMFMNNLSDARNWSENTCWMYDCDFEFLLKANVMHIIVTGPRAKDYYLRLLYAGFPPERISQIDCELDSHKLLRVFDNGTIYLLYGTDSIDLARQVETNCITYVKSIKDSIK